ncbi:MAG: 50S ribosomal protein L15 [Spirochaetia bacterium]|nr:50S ribosomal protein L15 [Spirochaetia bacterium]
MLFKDLKINAKKKTRRTRVGRGRGSGMGKTSTYGHKGQSARSGGTKSPWFEGGQQRVVQRIPKSGFNNPFPTEYTIVNVGFLDEKFEAGASVTREVLYDRGLIATKKYKLKILSDGELKKALNITADKFSARAAEKITAAGGKAETIK